MRILHIVSSPALSGVTSAIRQLAAGLSLRGCEPALAHYGADEGIAPELCRSGTAVHNIGAGLGPLRPMMTVRRARGLIKRLSPDIIHAHSFDADLVACRAAAETGIPLVITMHSFSYIDWASRRQNLYSRHCGALRRIISVSRLLAGRAAELPAFRGKPFSVIFNSPQERFFMPVTGQERTAARKALGIAGDETAIICVANFHPVKGQDILAEAFAAMTDRARLVIVGSAGSDPQRAAFRRKTGDILARSGAGSRTAIVDNAADSRPFLAAADIYVQPSLTEAMSVAVTEAMACGLPVVASRAGGLPEAVSDETGILVEPGNPRALAAALGRLAAAPELRAGMGAAGKAFAEKHFAPARYLDEHERLYRELCRKSA
ncbi:MAG: glycosyltransferase family 4 protein [Elusimicrobiales bacterium]